MRCLAWTSAIVVISLVFLVAAVAQAAPPRKIVVFADEVNEPAQEALIKAVGGVIVKDLPLITGKAVLLPPQAEAALGKMPGIVRIDPDIILTVFPLSGKPTKPGKPDKPGKGEEQPPQTLPWGIDRTDAEVSLGTYYATGAGVEVAVLDTGIDTGHPDLVVAGGVNIINPRKGYKDDNGHGTHVAGIIAALNNDIGVVGVAPEASLYAVKAFGRNGTAWSSDIIEGLDWCIQNEMQVINESFGSSIDNQSLHDAITKTANAGIIQVAAAGNDGSSVSYPAAYTETIAVSAIGKDSFASFSNYGPEIDYTAPGVDILSTYKGGGYKTLSGTSMAASHVTGVVALRTNTQDLKAEWSDKLIPDQQGNGIIDAEDTVNGDVPLIGNNYPEGSLAPRRATANPINKLTTTWGRLKSR